MSKRAIRFNSILCVVLLLIIVIGMPDQIDSFDESKNWFELFKALFWLVLSVSAFWILVYHLVTKKPLWRMWD